MPEASVARLLPATVTPLPEDAGQLRLLRTVLRNPLEAMPATAYTEATARRRFLKRDLLYVCDPDLIQQVLVEQEASFVKAEAMRRALVPALGEGLLTAEGAHWRWQRRAASPIFRHDRLLGFLPAMIAAATRTRDRWLARPGRPQVDVLREMMRTTYDVIVDTMLSGAPGLDQSKIERGISDYLDATPWAVMTSLFGVPEWVPYPRKRQGRIAQAYLRRAIIEVVNTRREQERNAGKGNCPDRPDLIRLLLEVRDPEGGRAMDDRELADNLMTFIVAGHETTALTLTWSLYLLALHPEAETRVVEEIEGVTGGSSVRPEHIQALAYTRRVVQEAMRLYPPAPLIARLAATEVCLGNLVVPEGTPTYVPVYAVHRHERLWDDADAFEPDRFLPEATRMRHRYAYMPFGAGPRICIGASFAMLEAVSILATLLQSVRFALSPGAAPTPRLRITLRPREGMTMTVRSRAG